MSKETTQTVEPTHLKADSLQRIIKFGGDFEDCDRLNSKSNSCPIEEPIDVQSIMNKIRTSMTLRKDQDPVIYAVTLAEDRLRVRDALRNLKIRYENHGSIGMPGPGLKGKFIFLVKRIVRKLIQRHLIQQKEELESLIKFLDFLIPLLDQQTRQIGNCLNRINELEGALIQMQADKFVVHPSTQSKE